jgi:hypothetical protein
LEIPQLLDTFVIGVNQKKGMNMKQLKRITLDPDIMGGKP